MHSVRTVEDTFKLICENNEKTAKTAVASRLCVSCDYDFMKPLLKRKPDKIILHIGTNDLTQNIDTCSDLAEITNLVRTQLPKCDFSLSECTLRTDRKSIEK